MQAFVVWLDGYLDATGGELNISKTNMIKNKLWRLFEHEALAPKEDNEIKLNNDISHNNYFDSQKYRC